MKNECVRCGHKWISRLDEDKKPVQCPRCHSGYWNMAYKRPPRKIRNGFYDI